MPEIAATQARVETGAWAASARRLPVVIAALAFALLFHEPARTLVRDWLSDPDAGHGLLLAPLAFYLAWKRGLLSPARPQPLLGVFLLTAAVLLRYGSGLAAELFTMRASMIGAIMGLIVYVYGVRQLLHWWLPVALIILSIPLPDVVVGTLALPLQFKASQIGAALLEWRSVPVLLNGNVLHLPDRALFVTEACSGLRSLTALLALGVLIAGIWLKYVPTRLLLILVTLPIAVLLNSVRVFLTGFLVYYVDPKLGDGLMHYTEGWVIFIIAFGCIGGIAWLLSHAETVIGRWRRNETAA